MSREKRQRRSPTESEMAEPSLHRSSHFLVPPDDAHNRRLVSNVRPPAWVNPPGEGRYNLVVIGAGSGGLVTAAGAAGLGARVALVERHLMGGDCLNVGCVPSKAMIRSARTAADVRRASRFGVHAAGDPSVSFGEVMGRVRRVRADISPHDSARRFHDRYGVDVFFGDGRLTGRDRAQVGDRTLRFRRAVIATGSRPVEPAIPGLAEAGFHTNETVFELTDRPPRLAVIGGGPIGCELAQAFARLGSRVTVIEKGEQLLHREDRDAAEILLRAFRDDGVDVRLRTTVVAVKTASEGKVLKLAEEDNEDTLVVDEILVAVGRRPNVEGLGLDTGGVAYCPKGIEVNEYLRTTNHRVYAAGDICLRHKFTHAADAAARIVIRNALFAVGPIGRRSIADVVVPWCTYTEPEIAHVGISAHQAEVRGLEIDTVTVAMSEIDRSVAEGEPEGFLKVHLRKGSDTILGAIIVSAHAGEMISELTAAMVVGTGLGTLSDVVHPYPTRAEAVRTAADRYNATRLTPTLGRFLERYFRWRR